MKTSFKSLLLAISATFYMGTALAADPVVLKFSHEAPETQIKGRTANFFADRVAELSNGSLKIEVFPSAQLIATKDEVRAAMRGQVDIIAPQTSYFVPFDESWDVFYQPLLFDNGTQGMDVIRGEVGYEMLADLSKNRLHGLTLWHDGPGYLFVKNEPVTHPKDLSGKKIRVFPSAPLEGAVREAGAIPVSIPGTDVYLALQQGLVEGVISAVTFATPSRWYEVVKGTSRMTMFVGGYGVVVNQAKWNSLSDEHKQILEQAAKEAEQWNYEQSLDNVQAAEATLLENGVTIADLSAEELKAWREMMQPVYDAQPAKVKQRFEQIQEIIKK